MAAIFYLSLFALIILGIRIGLYKLFEKAGEAGWKAFIPVYSDVVWLKLIGKPTWWIVLTLIPIVRTLIKISMDIELVKAYGKHRFGDQVKAVLIPFVYYPQIGFDQVTEYIGPPLTYDEAAEKYKKETEGDAKAKRLGEVEKKMSKQAKERLVERNLKELTKTYPNVIAPKSGAREWADAFLFAGVAAIIIRTFFIEAFMIPTSSMERTLMAGDFLFVSKYQYGSRMPMNPLSIPFVHNKIKIGKFVMPSYVDLIRLPYYRLPGVSDVKRNDIVVFNYPAHDIHDLGDGAGKQEIISMKENYIKRCVGMPGDTFQIDDGQIYVDGKKAWNPPKMQFDYYVNTDEGFKFKYDDLIEMEFRAKGESGRNGVYVNPRENGNWYPYHGGFRMACTEEIANRIRKMPGVTTVDPIFHPKGELRPGETMIPGRIAIYPNEGEKRTKTWIHNLDNFGPIVIPKKGVTTDITDPKNFRLYERVIEAYEGHSLKIQNGKAFIDGEEVTTYTFEKNYYMLMGDNRHNSQDSRYWGFVPDDHIVGKPLFVFFSYESVFGIRWHRIGTKNIN